MPEHLEQHLDADEAQDDAQAIVKISEVAGDGGQGEVEGTEPEDGEYVGGEHDKRVAADGEDGGDRVDGEGHVGGLNHDEGDQQRRRQPFPTPGLMGSRAPGLLDKKLVFVHLVCDWEETLEDLYEDVIRRVYMVVFHMPEHLDACIDEEDAEHRQYPLEACDDGRACEDEDAAQHQGADDAPEEHLVLVLPLDAEEREEHQEHEEVVHRQRLLYQVACQKLHRLLVRIDGVEPVDACTEHQRHGYPDGRHLQGLPYANLVLTIPAERLQVDHQHGQHQHIKQYPSPQGHTDYFHIVIIIYCSFPSCISSSDEAYR